MTSTELEAMVNNLTARVDLMQQILPTLGKQADLLATRADLSATRQDLRTTRQDVLTVVETTRQDLLAVIETTNETTKRDLLAVIGTTKQDLTQAMSDLEGRLRSQMLMLHEDAKSDSRLLAEHLTHLIERVDGLARLIERRH